MTPISDLLNLGRIVKLYRHIRRGIAVPALLGTQAYWYELFKTAFSIREVREMLTGYKTYIVAALTALATLLHSLGYMDQAMLDTLLKLLAAGGLATVSAKLNGIRNNTR